ncbi:hypothetical protein Glove_52g105 [Diversispora epigaea]|uniref:Uncharacterized protein n=1 Tax=Diversispora epigaea TaxID=1348612 RepID=A0A397JP87_9GLOM|nr:hypothetical protein Glove_52g105 [Diversispora epigaea]
MGLEFKSILEWHHLQTNHPKRGENLQNIHNPFGKNGFLSRNNNIIMGREIDEEVEENEIQEN